jgi:ABC-type multidrug transport system fused ATPase/permease subunit
MAALVAAVPAGGVGMTAQFDDVDLQNVTAKAMQVMQTTGASGAADVAAGLEAEAAEAAEVQTASAGGALRSGMGALGRRHGAGTDLLAQLNESHNSNRFIVTALSAEQARVGQLASRAKRDVYKVHQMSQHNGYAVHYYGFLGRVMMVTTFATVLVLMPVAGMRAGALKPGTAIALAVLVLAAYAAGMIAMFRNVGSRREAAWGQYYFKAMGEQALATASAQDGGACPSHVAP